jgi:hypothetical protein
MARWEGERNANAHKEQERLATEACCWYEAKVRLYVHFVVSYQWSCNTILVRDDLRRQ